MDYGSEKPTIMDHHRRKFSFLNAECAWDAFDADDASLSTCTTLCEDSSLYELGRISESMIDVELSVRLSTATTTKQNRKSGYRRSTKNKDRRRRSSATSAAAAGAATAAATATIEACNNAVQDFVQARATTVTNNMNFLGRVRQNLGEIGIADNNNQSTAEESEEKNEEAQAESQPQTFWQARMGTLAKNLETLSWAFQG